ncbi:hypothetical protein GEMRC1_001423 [Eukaryota sp. GEM-RC1]
MLNNLFPQLVHAINSASGNPGIFIASSGGSNASSALTSVYGTSKSFLGSFCGYHQQLTNSFLGFSATTYSSYQMAFDLITASLRYLIKALPDHPSFLPCGVCAALATNPPRRGSDRAFISIYSTNSSSLHLSYIEFKPFESSSIEERRKSQEDIVTAITLNSIALVSRVSSDHLIPESILQSILPFEIKTTQYQFHPQLSSSVSLLNSRHLVVYPKDNISKPRFILDHRFTFPSEFALFCGSFNPLHLGHVMLIDRLQSTVKIPCFAELTAVNADKGVIDDDVLKTRLEQFSRESLATMFNNEKSNENLNFDEFDALFPGVFVNVFPTFEQKTKFILSIKKDWKPVFVVGYDTAIRIVNSKYYDSFEKMQEMIDWFVSLSAKFFVAGRLVHGLFKKWSDDDVSHLPNACKLFLSLDDFRFDLSSSELRRQKENVL